MTSRNPRLYWGRFASAQIALALVAWLWFAFAGGTSAAKAKQIFGTLSTFSFVYCLIIGLFLTADSISEEKREGTLGLLFLTNLKGYDVAFGKLAANSFQAIYSLMAIFPVLTIPLLLGGLLGAEVFRMTLVLVVSLIFSLTIGLVSTWSKHDRKAQAGAFGLMVLLTGGFPALAAFLKHEYRINLGESLYLVSPGYAFANSFDSVYTKAPASFWNSVAVIHGISWIAFILGAVIVRRVWQDRADGASNWGWREAFRRWKRGSLIVRNRYRETLLGTNPYYWLVARDRLKPHYVLWFLGACGGFWFFLWLYNRKDMLEQEAFFATAVLVHTALKIWLASEAGRQFFEDRKSSALELTLSTPLPVREILEGQFLGLLRQFGPAVAVVLVFDVAGMIIGARMRFSSDSEWMLSWVAAIIIFLVDAATLAALGMWLGLSTKRFSRAVAKSLFLVLGLPWLIFFGVMTYMVVAHVRGMESLNVVVGTYFVISLLTDLVLFLNASGNLSSRFREIATQRFESAR